MEEGGAVAQAGVFEPRPSSIDQRPPSKVPLKRAHDRKFSLHKSSPKSGISFDGMKEVNWGGAGGGRDPGREG